MKLTKMALIATIACGLHAGTVFGDQANTVALVSHCDNSCDTGCSQGCDTGCDSGCDSDCGCSLGKFDLFGLFGGCGDKGCDSCGSCDSGCDAGGCAIPGCGDCCLGDPCKLFDDCCGWSVGGWLQTGYTSRALPLFNSYDDHIQLNQAWLYAEKAIDTSCGFDIGGRVDYMYGTDSQDTQAFGTDPRGWDNSWDNGGNYGRAMPQLYVEAGYGDWSVKAGHFYTIIGYEVVTAPDNFFYSHAYTMYNSEPFTHTGFLASYNVNDDVTVWGGYTFGWDSGFDDNGDAFLGGASVGLSDELTLTYATTAGRFGEARFNGVEKGYMHSIVADYALSDSLNYVFQSDLLDTEDAANATVRDTFGINQYLIKTVNDCLSYGARFEWYENEGVYTNAGAESDIYALTLGVNYKPHANVTVRPEIRWDWVENTTDITAAGNTVLENNDDDQTTFGLDTILTF